MSTEIATATMSSVAALRAQFDTLQRTGGGGGALVELQRNPATIPVLLDLVREELQATAPLQPPSALLLASQMLQKSLRRCPLESAAGVEALLLPALAVVAGRGWRPVLTQLGLAMAVLQPV